MHIFRPNTVIVFIIDLGSVIQQPDSLCLICSPSGTHIAPALIQLALKYSLQALSVEEYHCSVLSVTINLFKLYLKQLERLHMFANLVDGVVIIRNYELVFCSCLYYVPFPFSSSQLQLSQWHCSSHLELVSGQSTRRFFVSPYSFSPASSQRC